MAVTDDVVVAGRDLRCFLQLLYCSKLLHLKYLTTIPNDFVDKVVQLKSDA